MVVGKAYADWVSRAPELKGASQFIHDPPSLYAAGIEPVYVPTRLPLRGSYQPGRTVSVKNSVDVKMTADCIDTAHNFPNINTFVLVSGDSDFIHVINSLRAVGKRVVVVGVSWATSRRMADHVDGLIFYDSDVDPIEVEPPPVREPYQRGGRLPAPPPPPPLANPGRHQLPEVIRAIEDVIRTERAAGHRLLLTSLKQRLVRRIAGFDERKLGFTGFKKLMLRVAAEGNIKIRSVDLVDWVLMADEPDPAPEIRDRDDDDHHNGNGNGNGGMGDIDGVAPEGDDAAETAGAMPAAPTAPAGGRRRPRIGNGRGVDTTRDASVGDADVAPASPTSATAPAGPAPAEFAPTAAELAEAVAQLELPASNDPDGQTDRVADLIVMSYTLEERDGVDSIMFNALCNEISQALAAGIAAGDATVMAHWGASGVASRTAITRLVRGLAGHKVFEYRNISARDPETNRVRRRRVFGLNRYHYLTDMTLLARLGAPYEAARSAADASDPRVRGAAAGVSADVPGTAGDAGVDDVGAVAAVVVDTEADATAGGDSEGAGPAR